MIEYLLLISRQGKVRLTKWFVTLSLSRKSKIVKEVTQLVLARRQKMCNFIEYKEDTKIVYRRYASLFFVCGVSSAGRVKVGDEEDEEVSGGGGVGAVGAGLNELEVLEVMHRYVESLDKYFGNVCELDLIFNFQRAYYVLDELLCSGEMLESSRRTVLRAMAQQDAMEEVEAEEQGIGQILAEYTR
ncbi:hypothetical protein PYCC9005_005140 [Savitreella phatthalungensis]